MNDTTMQSKDTRPVSILGAMANVEGSRLRPSSLQNGDLTGMVKTGYHFWLSFPWATMGHAKSGRRAFSGHLSGSEHSQAVMAAEASLLI
jgi:hypothetical protein